MIKKIENRKNQTTSSMSGIPSLKRSSAMSCDETDKLIRKTIKYLTRLQATMDSWRPEEANKIRMQLLKILRPLEENENENKDEDDDDDEMDDGIDTSNIVVGKRQTRSVVRYEDEQFADLMLADVPDDELDAALDEDVSDDDKDDEMIEDDEDDEDWVAEEDEDWVDEDEEVENNLGRNRGQFLAETKEDDEE